MYSKEIINSFEYQPIEDLVSASLMAIKEIEMRKKFLTNVLIVGGGGALPQFADELIRRLSAKFESE